MLNCRIWCCGKVYPVRPAITVPPNSITRALRLNQKQQNLLCTSRNNCSVTAMEAPSEQPDNSSFGGFLTQKPYEPPSWASHLNPIPSDVFSLGHFPTPIHKWNLPNLPKNTEVWLKRDDLSGMQLSGNKVRKLEFLLADAVAKGSDCVITIGGIQSNHCRATAVAAKYLNLDCYLILRTSKVLVDKDPGLMGNLLVERLVGAHIDLVSKEEYAKIGSLPWLLTEDRNVRQWLGLFKQKGVDKLFVMTLNPIEGRVKVHDRPVAIAIQGLSKLEMLCSQ